MSTDRWCHPTISSSVIPFYSCLLSFQASGYFPAGWFFISGSQSIVALAAASVPPVNLFRVDFLEDWLVWSPCRTGYSQESPQLESIISLAFSLLYGPTLTSKHDYWKKHNLDYICICQQSNVCFLIRYVCQRFSSKEQASFNFMASVTVLSDFRAQENKGFHCFHCFSIYMHEVAGLDTKILAFWMEF